MKHLLILVLASIVLSSCGTKKNDNPTPTAILTISDFSPKAAKIGETVTITGKAFGADANAVSVRFGTSAAIKPKTITATTLAVDVPNDATTGKISVAVTGGETVISEANFTLTATPPVFAVTDFTPKTGTIGTVITITGSGFGTDANAISIKFNGAAVVRPATITATQLTVAVPAGTVPGKIVLSLQSGATVTTSMDFTIIEFAGNWIKKADYPIGWEVGGVSFTIDNKAYVGGSNGGAITEYDPAHDSWKRLSDFGGGVRAFAVAFAIAGKGYVGTGTDKNNHVTNDFWEFDPKTNVWTQKANFKGVGRTKAVGFAVGNKGYIGTGSNSSGNSLNDFYRYDPSSNSWAQVASIPENRSKGYSFVIGNNGYVGNGEISFLNYTTSLYMYDPSTNAWISKADTPSPYALKGASSFAIGNKGYVGLGFGLSNGVIQPTQAIFEYSPASNSWKRVADFTGLARTSAIGFSIGDTGYFGMGTDVAGVASYEDFFAFKP